MITRFGSLFAGHVDLDDHGLDATPVNDRWLPNERLLTVFDKATRIAKLLDKQRYDVFYGKISLTVREKLTILAKGFLKRLA